MSLPPSAGGPCSSWAESRVFTRSRVISRWLWMVLPPTFICAQPPAPEQGSVSPSGKFNASPAARSAATRSPSEETTGKPDAHGRIMLGKITIDPKRRALSFPASLNQREGLVEYALVHENGKVHEALLKTSVTPHELHVALLLLKAKPVPLPPDGKTPAASSVRVFIEWETNGPRARHPLEDLLQLAEIPGGDASPLASRPWHFNGSSFIRGGGYLADSEGSIISLIEDPASVLNNPRESRNRDDLHRPRPERLPATTVPLTIVLQLENP